MLIARNTFDETIELLASKRVLAFDTETTGLRHTDRLFSIIIADSTDEYYFNFNDYLNDQVLPRELLKKFNTVFATGIRVAHNAKFDLHQLAKENVFVKGRVYCTQILARLEYNTHMKYSLDACVNRLGTGYKKDDTVKKWITKHKAFTMINVPGKKQRVRLAHFERVPLKLMQKYGEIDARITYELFKKQWGNLGYAI